MTLSQLILAVFLIGASAAAAAETVVVADGLSVDPPAGLDFTYQTISDYDDHERVLARWAGEELQYFMTFDKLPAQYAAPDKYMRGLKQSVTAMPGSSADWLNEGTKTTAEGFEVSYLDMKLVDAESSQRQIAFHVSKGSSAYMILVPSYLEANSDIDLLAETLAVVSTAEQSSEAFAPQQMNESPYVGLWQGKATGPDGQTGDLMLDLRNDLSVRGLLRADGKPVWSFIGIWSLQGETLDWQYLFSTPELKEADKVDVDEIVSFDGKTLVLKSQRTEMVRRLRRQNSE